MSAFNEIDDGGPAFPQEATAESISVHTPGPWRIDYAQGIVAADGTVVAYAEANHSDTPSPDARLIAAAPDLLEALKDMLAELKEFRRILVISVSHGERMGGWLEDVEGMIAKIESAIAKAEGKS